MIFLPKVTSLKSELDIKARHPTPRQSQMLPKALIPENFCFKTLLVLEVEEINS